MTEQHSKGAEAESNQDKVGKLQQQIRDYEGGIALNQNLINTIYRRGNPERRQQLKTENEGKKRVIEDLQQQIKNLGGRV